MTEQHDGPEERLALAREEIAMRVANFKATQERFQREREAYYASKMEATRAMRWNKYAGGTSHR
jgi:hypothetical protein